MVFSSFAENLTEGMNFVIFLDIDPNMRKISLVTALLHFIIFLPLHAQVIYNAYANITSVTGSNFLTVNNVNQVNHTFNVNELVIVMQMQDDAIGTNTTNISTFGDLGSIQNAGRFEVAKISAVNLSAGTPTSIALATPLVNTYNTGTNSSVQLISFRRLSAAAFTTTNSITGLAWNGFVGGVVAIEVPTVFTLAHSITANALGFRGGVKNTPNGYTSCDATTYITALATRYAGKGEGIYKNTNPAFNAARGKILNGGGGGNDVNAGGGGGGNFTSGGTGGLGWVPAGTGCSPGAFGLAGISLSAFINPSRVFMGGGGGGGHENDGVGSPGGAGGGIILVKTGTLVTTGICGISITANGATATSGLNDGCGGGGAAGSIVMQVNTYSIAGTCPLSITANGGGGGSSVTAGSVHGGGGGGGEGAVIFPIPQPMTNVTTNTLPGTGGTSCVGCTGTVSGVAGTGPNNSGIITNTIGVLPIELLYFHATDQGESVLLNWSTATEKNTDYFLVERSTDAVQWNPIGKVKAAGNSNSKIDYQLNDSDPLSGLSYYRLKNIDFDNTFQYSNTEVIERENNDEFMVYPNPSNGSFHIRLKHQQKGSAILNVFDATGKLVFTDGLNSESGSMDYEYERSLDNGIYYIKIDSNGKPFNYKLIIIK